MALYHSKLRIASSRFESVRERSQGDPTCQAGTRVDSLKLCCDVSVQVCREAEIRRKWAHVGLQNCMYVRCVVNAHS